MKAISLDLGKDFEAVTVSFEPKDTPALAQAKRDVYAGQYGRPEAANHWHFLTGEQQSIGALTDVVGFRYAYDSSIRQYAHAAAILVLTPEGRIDPHWWRDQQSALTTLNETAKLFYFWLGGAFRAAIGGPQSAQPNFPRDPSRW